VRDDDEDPRLLVSPHDGLTHAFPATGYVGNVAEAMCSHSAPANQLKEPTVVSETRACIPCSILLGDWLAVHREDATWR